MSWISALIVVGIAVVAVVLGSYVTKLCFRIVDRRSARASSTDLATPARSTPSRRGTDPNSVEAAASTLRGGAWIGALERVAIYSGLLLGWPEAIAIALAVKGLGRYPELKSGENSAVAERFIIGTFVSVLWACGCAGLAHELVNWS